MLWHRNVQKIVDAIDESIGYWDFWRKQALIPGQDCETVCGLLASIPGKLDDADGEAALQLGHPAGGELRRAPAGGLRGRGAAADDAHGRARGRVHRL